MRGLARFREPAALFLLFFLVLAPAGAGGRQEEAAGNGNGASVDYVGIAAVMIRDGNYERAESALSRVDPENPDVDLPRYHTLQGLLSLRTGEDERAVDAFQRAVAAGQRDSSLYAYLAQAHYRAGDHQSALESISEVDNLNRFPSLYGLRAASEWELGRWEDAFGTLRRASLIFPDQVGFTRQRIVYLLELNLTQAASELSLAYLDDAPPEPETYVTIGEALRRGEQYDAAVQVLEMARMRFPESEEVKLLLANAYLSQGMVRTAGRLIEEAAARNVALYYEAAELYRRAGDLTKASYLNSLVIDQAKKSRQRFNILLMRERYEEAVALEPRLVRTNATEDDRIRYSLAYAYFRSGQLERAVDYLQGIEDQEIFSQAVELRAIIERRR